AERIGVQEEKARFGARVDAIAKQEVEVPRGIAGWVEQAGGVRPDRAQSIGAVVGILEVGVAKISQAKGTHAHARGGRVDIDLPVEIQRAGAGFAHHAVLHGAAHTAEAEGGDH
ncbi:hypothetical protein CSC81_17730, partial [Tenacibaculum discolor]